MSLFMIKNNVVLDFIIDAAIWSIYFVAIIESI